MGFFRVRPITIFFWLIIGVVFFLFYNNRGRFLDNVLENRQLPFSVKKAISKISKRPLVVVFVHGTVGTTVSLLDAGAVAQDQIDGTTYKAVISRIRNNPLFWKEQMVMQKGLVYLNKYFDKSGNLKEVSEDQLLAAPMMANIFIKIAKLARFDRKILTFSYGWSGLLSQSRRRSEALRFYNDLSRQLAYQEKVCGIFDPEVVLVCYSHGGTLALNMAGIYNASLGWPDKHFQENHPEVVSSFDQLLSSLPKGPTGKESDYRFDYAPVNHNFKVDKLVLLGCPVQPESSCLAGSEFFKQVFNLYSLQDSIQTADYISSKDVPTVRAFSCMPGVGFEKVKDVQLTNGPLQALGQSLVDESADQKKMPWWQAFLGMKDITRRSLDPTHKELWFFYFDKSESMDCDANPIKPLPVLVFVPLILYSLEGLGRSLMVNFSFVGGGDLLVKAYDKDSKEERVIGRIDNLALIGLKRVGRYQYSLQEAARIEDCFKSLIHFSKKIQKQG